MTSAAHLIPDVGARNGEHVQGSSSAPITLVEYGDFECPYCGMAYPIVKAIQQRLGDRLQFVFRHFPLGESHPHAEHAAEASEAAAKDGRFWEMHDVIYERQRKLDDDALAEYASEVGADATRVATALTNGTYATVVHDDFRSGVRSGVNGTPTFFINGSRFDGPWTDEESFLEALLAEG